MTLVYSNIGDANSGHLGKVMSARSFYYKGMIFPFIINKSLIHIRGFLLHIF